MWNKFKGWILAFVGLIAGLILLGRKPKWVREKEREIKGREKKIEESKYDHMDAYDAYEEVKADHDEAIKQAAEQKARPPITDADDAAGFLDDILKQRKR